MAYIAAMALTGALFIRYVRAGEHTKHATRSVVKWILRIIATMLIFHSTASPAVALTYVTCLMVFYILYALQKSVVTKVFKQ